MKKTLGMFLFMLYLFSTTSVTFADETPHGEKLYRRFADKVGDNNALGLMITAFASLAIGSGASCLKNVVKAKNASKNSSKLYYAAISAITGSLTAITAPTAGLFAYVLLFK